MSLTAKYTSVKNDVVLANFMFCLSTAWRPLQDDYLGSMSNQTAERGPKDDTINTDQRLNAE